MFTANIKGVSRNFEGCFKEGSRVVQGNFRELSRLFKKIPKGVQVRLKGLSSSFKGVSKVFKKKFNRCCRGVLMVSQRCFMSCSRKFQGRL